jgi:hypothetical protein
VLIDAPIFDVICSHSSTIGPRRLHSPDLTQPLSAANCIVLTDSSYVENPLHVDLLNLSKTKGS